MRASPTERGGVLIKGLVASLVSMALLSYSFPNLQTERGGV